MSLMDRMKSGSVMQPVIVNPAQSEMRKPTAQESMMIGLMQKMLPGLDLAAIAKIGEDAQEFAGRVGATLAAHTKALEDQAEQLDRIEALLIALPGNLQTGAAFPVADQIEAFSQPHIVDVNASKSEGEADG